MAIYTLTPAQLKGAGIYNSFEIPAGGGSSFSSLYSFVFDGSNDYIDASNNISNVSSDADGSVSAWVRPAAIGGGMTIFLVSDVDAQREYFYFGLTSDNRLYAQIKDGVTTSQGWYRTADGDAISVGDWVHVAVTHNGTISALYVNGEPAASTVGGSYQAKWINALSGLDTINIGRLVTSNLDQNYFNGNIDEVSYYDYALSAAEVSIIYNSGTPGDLTTLHPVLWYRMGETGVFDRGEWEMQNSGSAGNTILSNTLPEAARTGSVPS